LANHANSRSLLTGLVAMATGLLLFKNAVWAFVEKF